MENKCASWEVIQQEMLILIMNTHCPGASGGKRCCIILCGLIQAGISQVTASSDTWEQEGEEKTAECRLLTILMKKGIKRLFTEQRRIC